MVVDENVDSVNDLEARVKLTTQNFHMHLSLPGLMLCFICAIKDISQKNLIIRHFVLVACRARILWPKYTPTKKQRGLIDVN